MPAAWRMADGGRWGDCHGEGRGEAADPRKHAAVGWARRTLFKELGGGGGGLLVQADAEHATRGEVELVNVAKPKGGLRVGELWKARVELGVERDGLVRVILRARRLSVRGPMQASYQRAPQLRRAPQRALTMWRSCCLKTKRWSP